MTNTQHAQVPQTLIDYAVTLIHCASRAEATIYASSLKGKTLAAVVELFGCTTYGNVAQRRLQLVNFVIGAALNSAAIRFYDRPVEKIEYLTRNRVRLMELVNHRASR